jgi:hypothetical protein
VRPARVHKLIAQVGDIALAEAEAEGEEPPRFGANATERAFIDRWETIGGEGALLLRHGWPDFLVEHPKLGIIAVEVKRPPDYLRANQRRMLTALERAGIAGFVWSPKKPRALTPWRKHAELFKASTPQQRLARRRRNRERFRGLDDAELRESNASL